MRPLVMKVEKILVAEKLWN